MSSSNLPSISELNHPLPDGSSRDMIYCILGHSISAEEAAELAEHLKVNEHDLKARLKLLGYHDRRQIEKIELAKRQNHILWMIDNRPTDYVSGYPVTQWVGQDSQYYEEAKLHWLRQAEGNQENANILANAASFVIGAEPQLAKSFFLRALEIEPNNKGILEQLKQAEEFIANTSD